MLKVFFLRVLFLHLLSRNDRQKNRLIIFNHADGYHI